jgi:hypothetical protein
MSPHDLRSNFQDSGALQLEMRYRTPSLDSVSRWGRAVGALQAPPDKRLYVLISGMATLLFRAIGPEPPHNGRSGSALLQSLPGRSGCIDDRPIDGANTIFLLKSGNLRRGVGRAGLAVTVSSWSPGRPREKGRQTRYLACARPAFVKATPAILMRINDRHPLIMDVSSSSRGGRYAFRFDTGARGSDSCICGVCSRADLG